MLVFTIHVSQFIRYPSQNSKAKKKRKKERRKDGKGGNKTIIYK